MLHETCKTFFNRLRQGFETSCAGIRSSLDVVSHPVVTTGKYDLNEVIKRKVAILVTIKVLDYITTVSNTASHTILAKELEHGLSINTFTRLSVNTTES